MNTTPRFIVKGRHPNGCLPSLFHFINYWTLTIYLLRLWYHIKSLYGNRV